MVILKHPNPDMGGLSTGGVEYDMVNGFMEVPEHVLPIALEFGYQPVTKAELEAMSSPSVNLTPEALKSMSKKQLIDYCSENGIDVPTGTKVEGIRALVAEYEGHATPPTIE